MEYGFTSFLVADSGQRCALVTRTFNNNCSTSRARVIGMLHCTFKVYLLAIFIEDELMSDTLIQYCSER